MHWGWRRSHMKKTVSAHVYNTIERYPQILKTPKVEKAMGNLKCWMALRVNRGFDNSSYKVYRSKTVFCLFSTWTHYSTCRVYVYIYQEFILYIIHYDIYIRFFQDHSVWPSLSNVSEIHNLHTCCSFQATPPGPNQQNPTTAVVRDGRTAKWEVVKKGSQLAVHWIHGGLNPAVTT